LIVVVNVCFSITGVKVLPAMNAEAFLLTLAALTPTYHAIVLGSRNR
jgi:hypothetical protein